MMTVTKRRKEAQRLQKFRPDAIWRVDPLRLRNGGPGISLQRAAQPHTSRRRATTSTICRVRISCSWFAWALLAGTLYLIIGVGFAPLSVPSLLFWRLAAWMVSAVG